METHSVLRRIFCIAWIIAGLAFGANPAVAEETNAPAQKTISVAKTEIVPSLIVMNARGASLQGETLTLDGVAPSSIVFADRPVRAAGHMLTIFGVEVLRLQKVPEPFLKARAFTRDLPASIEWVIHARGGNCSAITALSLSPLTLPKEG